MLPKGRCMNCSVRQAPYTYYEPPTSLRYQSLCMHYTVLPKEKLLCFLVAVRAVCLFRWEHHFFFHQNFNDCLLVNYQNPNRYLVASLFSNIFRSQHSWGFYYIFRRFWACKPQTSDYSLRWGMAPHRCDNMVWPNPHKHQMAIQDGSSTSFSPNLYWLSLSASETIRLDEQQTHDQLNEQIYGQIPERAA